MKIQIIEWADQVVINLIDPNGQEIRYSFDQEDTHRNLVDLFHRLGFENVTYEEAY